MVTRTELVHEEFNYHRTNENTTAQGTGSKRRMGEKTIMRNCIMCTVHDILLRL